MKRAAEEGIAAPFDRSYWVVPGRLLAGAYPGDLDPERAEEKVRAIVEAGIRCFIDLTSPGDLNMFGDPLSTYAELPGKIAAGRFKTICRQMAVSDLDVPSRQHMIEILDMIDATISRNLPVYIHCLGGIGRTGTVVGCWLARHGIAQGQAVIELIKKLRRNEAHARLPSPETARQRRFVAEWKPEE